MIRMFQRLPQGQCGTKMEGKMRSFAFASAAEECVCELWVGACGAAANRWGCAAGWRWRMVSVWGHGKRTSTSAEGAIGCQKQP